MRTVSTTRVVRWAIRLIVWAFIALMVCWPALLFGAVRPPRNVTTFETAADLAGTDWRSVSADGKATVILRGWDTAGDGRGGVFLLAPTNTIDATNTIDSLAAVASGVPTGRWQRTVKLLRQVPKLSDVDTLVPAFDGESVQVAGVLVAGDAGPGINFTFSEGSVDSTNDLVRASVTGTGRWLAEWNGDLRWFGVFPSESDTSSAINLGLVYSAASGIEAGIRVPGRYVVTNPVVVPSNCRFAMHPESVLIRRIASSTADALPQEATVKNAGMAGWQTMGELSLVNSNITLTGLRCRTESADFYGFHLFMQGVADLALDRLHVERSYRAWAVTIAASNCVVNLPKIRNGGEDGSYVYQDGIHITGGQNIRIVGPDIVSGDDSIGIGQHSMPIRDVVVVGGNLRSTHAQNIRGFIGYDYATNLIERVGFYNVTGSGGSRNAILQTGTASTNVARPFRDWIVDGLLAVSKQVGTTPTAFDAGLIVRNCDGFIIQKATVPYSIEPNLLLLDADNVTVDGCRFGGTGWNTYNQTIRVERAERLRLLNNRIENANSNSAYGLYLVGSGNVLVLGNAFSTWSTCIALASSNRFPTIKHNFLTATGGSQRGLTAVDLPTNMVFALNEISASSPPSFAGGSAPDNYVIDANIGYSNPNSDRHVRSDNFGPHVRLLQTAEGSTNAIYSSNDRIRLKDEEQAAFFASWDLVPGSTVFYTLGDSSGSVTPLGATIQGENGVGTNIATAPLTIRPGRSTGTATPPPFVLQVYDNAGASNAIGHTAIDAIRLATTNMIAGQAIARLGYWTGGFFNQGRLVRTNIGGINYWIDP